MHSIKGCPLRKASWPYLVNNLAGFSYWRQALQDGFSFDLVSLIKANTNTFIIHPHARICFALCIDPHTLQQVRWLAKNGRINQSNTTIIDKNQADSIISDTYVAFCVVWTGSLLIHAPFGNLYLFLRVAPNVWMSNSCLVPRCSKCLFDLHDQEGL